jgi:hypothetical protein
MTDAQFFVAFVSGVRAFALGGQKAALAPAEERAAGVTTIGSPTGRPRGPDGKRA